MEKNTDLLEGDPRRKFKGRVGFQGNNVKTPNKENAVLVDLGSSPSSVRAGRLVDAFGLRQMSGFISVGEGAWPSCYVHKGFGPLLSVCVDDFKLAGPNAA